MNEQAQVRRGPGRPRKHGEDFRAKGVAIGGEIAPEVAAAIIAQAEARPLVDEQTGMRVYPPSPSHDIDSDYVLKAPSKFVIDIRSAILANLDTEARARIVVCNEIKIVCKTIDAKGRTVNHSRHDAEWLKEYV